MQSPCFLFTCVCVGFSRLMSMSKHDGGSHDDGWIFDGEVHESTSSLSEDAANSGADGGAS